ncbi:GNAT family N-acetyltransferase [Leucobacter viscericola]|uniref:GNAT family N-acetyltransferase n=1 Tax=Leucobacter viscericola TaxID=2714935 RepID=A0A6G7XDM2_9MICO|nr:GNAT family N-acetyltransferase [Leucobacter viscericola]QIK62710.1 GNAT family N-acetyltransferase [Leucobacter viscericola]
MGDSAGALVSRELRGHEEFRAAAELYVRVFQYRAPEFALNPNLLSAIAQNGGSAVGVFTPRDEMIGFAYGFAGRDAHQNDFHYSQAATVDPRFQGKGVGRLLKLQQARVAERWGHQTMRWTFDPTLARNAHFNFDSLGAVGIDFLPSYYSRPGSDRILVEWTLAGRQTLRVPAQAPGAHVAPSLGAADWGFVREDGEAQWIAFPAVPVQNEAEAARVSERLAKALQQAFLSGRVLIRCARLNDDTAAYLAVPGTREETV